MIFDHEYIKFVKNTWYVGGYDLSIQVGKDPANYGKYSDAIEKILKEGNCKETLCLVGWKFLTFSEGLFFYFTPRTMTQFNSMLDAFKVVATKYKFQVKIFTSHRMKEETHFEVFQFCIQAEDLLKVFSEVETASYNLNVL